VEFGLIGAAGTASQAARPKNGGAPGGAGGDAIALASFGAVVDALAGDDADEGSPGLEIDPLASGSLADAGGSGRTSGVDEAARKLAEFTIGVELPPTLAPVPPPVAKPAASPMSTGATPLSPEAAPISTGGTPLSTWAMPPLSTGATPPLSTGATPPLSTGATPPVSAAATSVSTRAASVSKEAAAVPRSTEPMPVAPGATPVSNEALLVSVAATPVSNEALLVSVAAAPVSKEALPVSVAATPVSNEALLVSMAATPVSKEPLPVSVAATPVSLEITPDSRAMPVAPKAVPVSTDALPVLTRGIPVSMEPGVGIPAGEQPVDAPLDLPLRPMLPGLPDRPEINPDLGDRRKDEPPVLDLPLRVPQPREGERSAIGDRTTQPAADDNTALKSALAQADRAMSFRAALKLSVAAGSSTSGPGETAGPSGLSRSIADLLTRAFSGAASRAESGAATATSLAPASMAPAPTVAPHAAAIVTHALATGFSATLASSTLAPDLTDAPPASTAMQIVQAVRMQWSRGVGEARITLQPQHFGQVSVSLRVEDGQVVARLQAETPAVREWLQTNQASLRQSLAEMHLTLQRLEITEPPAEARHDERRERPTGQPRDEQFARRSRRDDTGETFDVVV
jgi:hypothetical protein